MTDCPCGSGRPFEACCGPHIDGTTPAPTPEALMRSRYSAFVKAEIGYLHDTLAPESRGDFDRDETDKWARSSRWQGLEIHAAEETGDSGAVDFTARYVHDGKPYAHRELSKFRKEDGRWYYVDGAVGARPVEQRVAPKIGRNDPCPCGSGKKYKKCCGA
ncbi:MAG: YchJ family protein [Actinomycetota bacterium]